MFGVDKEWLPISAVRKVPTATSLLLEGQCSAEILLGLDTHLDELEMQGVKEACRLA
jgi:hypothetical protein